jgi:hypothetical protein
MKKITLLSIIFIAFGCKTSSVNSEAVVGNTPAQEVVQNEVKTEKPKPEIITDVPVEGYGDAILNGAKVVSSEPRMFSDKDVDYTTLVVFNDKVEYDSKSKPAINHLPANYKHRTLTQKDSIKAYTALDKVKKVIIVEPKS